MNKHLAERQTQTANLPKVKTKTKHYTFGIDTNITGGNIAGNKTGELADTENDTAIVHGSNCTYVLSVMCTSSKSAGHSQSMIRTISSIVYNYLNS